MFVISDYMFFIFLKILKVGFRFLFNMEEGLYCLNFEYASYCNILSTNLLFSLILFYFHIDYAAGIPVFKLLKKSQKTPAPPFWNFEKAQFLSVCCILNYLIFFHALNCRNFIFLPSCLAAIAFRF